jgi:hypothetical protein
VLHHGPLDEFDASIDNVEVDPGTHWHWLPE